MELVVGMEFEECNYFCLEISNIIILCENFDMQKYLRFFVAGVMEIVSFLVQFLTIFEKANC
jgi:hypothetical protein